MTAPRPPEPLVASRAALAAIGLVTAIAFPLSIASLAWFLLAGA